MAGRLHSLKAAYPPHPIGGRLRKDFEESPQPQTAASGVAAVLAPLQEGVGGLPRAASGAA